jgi:choline kinase
VRALILAAGRGRRLAGHELPKCLLRVGPRTLLDRMLDALLALGVTDIDMVVGYEQQQVRDEVAALRLDMPVGFVENPRFVEGSVISLACAGELFGRDDLLIMDADVLFPVALLRRLAESSHANAFLLDPRSEAGGEEMMLAAEAGRVHRIARRFDPAGYDRLGEGVGFLKVAQADQASLLASLRTLIDQGETEADYEQGIDAWLSQAVVGYEEVGDLPWTEIDFPEDAEQAQGELLAQVDAVDRA